MRLLATGLLKHAIAPILAVTAIGAAPSSALARHHEDDRPGGIHPDLGFHVGPYFEHRPVYEDREVRVWVEPVYRVVTERQWVPAEYRTVTDRQLVPARFEEREVVRYERGRRCVYREQVCVQPAHYEDVTRQELVCDGHWDNVQHQEVVEPGHWETHVERVQVRR